ncbi:MAG TPA: FtsX-like permease family protein [Candidatus Polarisedimenticolia bacterium]|nr:FtsX-like permease family protein [Candidatus Polarisedimenticolia bacterium]
MIGHMIVRNALHRPMRTVITVIAVAVEVTLVIIVVGLTSGLLSDVAKRTEGVGADIMVQPPSASVFMAFSGAPMPISIADKLLELEYVQAVAPVLVQFNSVNGLDIVYGIQPDSFRAVSGGFVLHDGHDLQDPNDILVDDVYARAKDVKVGQKLHILEHDFRVAGIVEHGKGARLFVLMSTLQEMSGSHDKASVFFIKCDRSDHTAAVTDEIRGLLPRYEIRPLKDYISLMTSSNLPGLNVFINVMIGIAVAIGFLVIFLSMYTTIIERTREIGVLKSLGASKGYIVKIVMSETTLLCAAGVGAGVGLSYLMRAVFLDVFPSLTILITPKWIVLAGLIAVLGGLLGASYPAWLASRRDPVEALAYE